ncbi:MAG: DegT/DnrJ/EryC1/StrS family aminotransferase [Candidatus Nanopelagicales bacterium]|nr:DegT/DnrJ/EryC1/StrS family aminotransferase [Candidatus Nanopelagicales bacterium]MCF8536777.1 DegT/DnrJ/EryC1/StrS family aminotransferase [Candidatus Nanopelagicales bacterium]MCF8541762.1 DegT/DnrJ/EryC1/StrS family aminotransferase [Candidatus Nanopelagicales bacterium]MCF8556197.1 DegT/DnrJ/EryC1/StrS family aminotransferase [Candidatus Nanopelagicales bacterium]
MIPYGRQDLNDDDLDAVARVLHGDWLTTGPAVAQFEADLSEHTGGVPAIAVSSGTAALHAAYAAAGVGPGDEVITPPMTFVATQATAALLGARIVFADVRPDTATIDSQAVEAAISPRTRAIVAVDYAGHPADMDALSDLARRHGSVLIEDAAHSIGSTYRDRPVGALADLTTLSFFPTKNITTGEGGAVVAPDPEMLERARLFSRQGLVRDPARMVLADEGPWHQEVHAFGLNYRLPDILAALGSAQLSRLSHFKARRREIKARYDAAFEAVPELQTPHCDPGVDPMWHLYPLQVPADQRRRIFEHLRAEGVLAQVNYIPAYWHPAFDSREYPRGLCPAAEAFYRREISLPMHTRLTLSEQDQVIEALLAALQN